MWKDFNKSDLELCLKQPYDFFLVRQKGLHPASGKKFVPITVQLIDGKLFTCENELDPLAFSTKHNVMEPSDNPFECALEWMEIPE